MIKWPALYVAMALAFVGTEAAAPKSPPQTVEQVCASAGARLQDARVRVAWTELATVHESVQISYCILRGEKNAKLDFERDAEIVYFGLASEERNAPRKSYVFTIKTSEGRIIQQGPATLQPVAKQPQSCRVEVCQFFTNPGERVVQVSVVTPQPDRKR
jgi:hypothetical protein